MSPNIRIKVAKSDIYKTFDALPSKVLTLTQLRNLVEENREDWRLGSSTTTTTDGFINVMLKSSPLSKVKLPFPHRKRVVYTWREVSTFDLLQSLDPKIYFSHYTALHLHGLTEQIPKTIYLNLEQKMRPGGGTLTQVGIDRAFKAKCRVSNNVIEYEGQRIYILSGGNTDQLGVIEIDSPESDHKLRITNIERTLIDATVRPIYVGGTSEVAKAYELAKDHVSVNTLVAYLRKLNYTYPYHQAIGFYLERAKYKKNQIALLDQIETDFDFYLTYGMKESEYVKKWRLYIPKGF